MKLIFTSQYANVIFLINGLIVLFYLGSIRKDRQRAMKFGNYETLEKVAGRAFLRSHNIFLLIRVLAVTALLIGISNPVLVQQAPSSSSAYVLAIDSSSSMLAQDIKPTRFKAAKQLSSDFIAELPKNSRVGVVSFAGTATVEQQLTMQQEKAAAAVSNIDVGDRAGTAIGDALSASVSLLLGTNQSRSVILMTDGRNNVGSPVNASIVYAQNNNVTIHTIGLGSTNRSIEGSRVISGENVSEAEFPNLDVSQLERIANRTGGDFIPVTNRTQFKSALLGLSTSKVKKDVSHYLILIGAGLLLLEWLLATTRFSVIP
ncbi:MAG: VWA domain-containing protein [Candidatus Nanohaloarchaea archaeon]